MLFRSVTAFATNTCGISTCSFTVVVNDNQPPTITCPSNITINANTSGCRATTTLTAPTVSYNCAYNINALSFDGDDDYVQQTNNFVPGTTDFTIETWVYPISTANNQMIFGEDESGNYISPFFLIYYSNLTIGFCLLDNNYTGSFPVTNSTISLNTWSHIAVVRQGTNCYIYINGVLAGQNSASSVVNCIPSGRPFRIGGRGTSNTGPQNPFSGKIKEFRIWNIARSQVQIQASLNNEISAQSGLLALYHFNQGVANGNNGGVTTATDASGNNNTGTLNNFALSGTVSNWVYGTGNGTSSVSNNAPSTFP